MFGSGKSLMSWRAICIAALFLLTASSVRAESESSDPVVVILFMFFGLGVGIIIMQVLSALGDPIPYTCVVFAAGIVFSLAHKSDTGLFGDSVSDWVNIDADLLLFAFLPPLIFGEAMNLNFYHVRGAVLQAILLAGPGVLIGAALVGVITKYLLPYNWSWNLAMCFGAILSATDTVAVVSLLKQAGASPKLTIIIVGESLLNDGTAMVLFTIFYESLNGRLYSVGSVAYFFITAAFGSLLLGGVSGLIMIRWLRTANRPLKEIDTTIQIAITFTCAYMIFFLAQYVLKISGPLAVCGAGVVLSWLAPPIILSHETMHNVWGMVEWVLNTLIFLLAGLIIGNRVINKVAPLDWFYVFVLYGILMAVRAISIAMLFPLLSTIGHKCTRNEAIFMSWGGLRGALGMALALLVERNCPDDLHDETSRLFFYVGGIGALTMIINATTANQVLVYLGLLGNDSAEKNLVMQQIKKRLKRRMDSVLVEMAVEFSFTPQDLDEVRDSCSLLADSNMDSLYRDSERMSMQQVTNPAALVPSDMLFEASISKNSKRSITAINASASAAPMAPLSIGSASPSAHHHVKFPSGASIAKATTPAFHDMSFGSNIGHVSDDEIDEGSASDDEDDLIATNNPASSIFSDARDSRRRASSLRLTRSPSPHSPHSPRTPQSAYTPRSEYDDEDSSLHDDLDRVRHERENHAHQNRSRLHSHNSTRTLSHSGRARSGSALLRTKSVSMMKADEIVRLLSMSGRGPGAFLVPQLLTYVRAIFLEILRVRYWHDIERGKIPRQSHSAKFLLYSVEVGVDEVEQNPGARDWLVINKEITEQPLSIRILASIDATLPHTYGTYYLGKLEARREKRAVYMLNSFIDAHEHAQKKVHEFIADDEEGDERVQSPEELKVIDESKQAVAVARKLLSDMNADTVAKIRAKQAAALVLTKQAELIKNMVSEGLLTPQHAEEFLMEISDDLQRMEKDRNKMYWEQGEKLAKKRQALRKAEAEAEEGRNSIFNLFDWQRGSSASYGDADAREKDEIYLGPDTVTTARPLLQASGEPN